MEHAWWARWLAEGGLQHVNFINGRHGLQLVHLELHEELHGYVIAVFEKKRDIVTRGWKRFVPYSLRRAYRTGQLGLRLLRELDMSSPRTIGESLSLSAAILKAKADSLIDVPWLKALHGLARELDRDGIAGDFVECGVFRGGSATLLGAALRRSRLPRHLWLFDSFQGLPRPTEPDGPSAPILEGDLVGDEQNVRRLLRKVSAPLDRIQIVAGWFHETLPTAPIDRIALLHIDADWYGSVKLCLERFYELLEPGAVVVLDDYYDWPGCKAALDDFARARSLRIALKGGGDEPAYFRKPA
jgi:O-methyltransferase